MTVAFAVFVVESKKLTTLAWMHAGVQLNKVHEPSHLLPYHHLNSTPTQHRHGSPGFYIETVEKTETPTCGLGEQSQAKGRIRGDDNREGREYDAEGSEPDQNSYLHPETGDVAESGRS